jgi:hypothetical protein
VALQSSNIFLAGDAYVAIRSNSAGWKAQSQNALTRCQGGSIDTDFIFRLLDQTVTVVNALTSWKATAGLDAFATGQAYPTTMTTDCNTCVTAAQAIISWVTTNFPVDAGGFLQGYTLNADGSRTARSFTTAQTAGLQTSLTNFIATIV